MDIDDVFVGKNRLLLTDAKELLASQARIRKNHVPGFRYNLGFSGRSFRTGSEAENLADAFLVDKKDNFWWFPHDWNHIQPHLYDNATALEEHMILNRQVLLIRRFCTKLETSSLHSQILMKFIKSKVRT